MPQIPIAHFILSYFQRPNTATVYSIRHQRGTYSSL